MSKSTFSSDEHIAKQHIWVHKILVAYWVIIAVHGGAQLLSYWFLSYEVTPWHFYIHILLLPTLAMGAITLLAQLLHRRYHLLGFYSLFIAGSIISLTIIWLNYDIRIITGTLLLPVFASVIFFNKRLTLFSAALQLLGLGVLMLDASFRSYLSVFDMVAIPLFLLLGTLLTNIIRISGQELLSDLQSTLLAKQDLIIQNALMVKLATTDALTHLYNHISFHEYYQKAIEYADSVPFHLALIDIDNFKSINDTYGHRTGDIILARVAHMIRDHIGPHDIAARYGGEEFALLLFEKSFEEAHQTVEHIREQLSQLHHHELLGGVVTVSIGLHSYTTPLNKEQLFEIVDGYLYAAKRSGKNRTVTSNAASPLEAKAP